MYEKDIRIDQLIEAAGTQADLATRLAVSLNPDGSLKTSLIPTFDGIRLPDEASLQFGDTMDVSMYYETKDPDANALLVALPNGGAVDVPVLMVGDQHSIDQNLGFFNGLTQPRIAVIDADADTHVGMGFESDDNAMIQVGGAKTTLALNPSGGNVAIGTTFPLALLGIRGTAPDIRLTENTGLMSAVTGTIDFYNLTQNTARMEVYNPNASFKNHGEIRFYTTDGTLAQRMVLSETGRLGVGIASPLTEVHIVSTSTSDPRGLMSAQHSTDAIGGRLHLRKSRGTPTTPTVVVANDVLGRLRFSGYDGSTYIQTAGIQAVATGTIGSTRVPSDLVFSTGTNAAPTVLTNRMRIDNKGNVAIGIASATYRLDVYDNLAGYVERIQNDEGTGGHGLLINTPNGTGVGAFPLSISTGSFDPILRVYGNMVGMERLSIGTAYIATPPPNNGLIVEGLTAIGASSASGQLHVDQNSGTAAIPVLYLDQGDEDQPLIQFEATIGIGNAIEAVGGKTLTTTHFLMVKLPGGLTRYIPCGTIA